jgi:hypothetical protein
MKVTLQPRIPETVFVVFITLMQPHMKKELRRQWAIVLIQSCLPV